ncbi:MAG: hypothetical protein ABIM99_05155 [Candidatus Dojkabacteria bacterium]
MAESQTSTSTIKLKAKKFILKIGNDYLVVRNLLGLTCFALAFGLFISYAYVRGDIAKTLVAIMGLVIVFLSLGIILEFILKTVAMENNPNVKRFSALLSVNMLLGLAAPLFIFNMILWGVVELFSQMHYYGTVLCQIRVGFINFYYYNAIFFQVNNFIKIVIVAAFFMFVVGGFVERYWKK